MFAGLRKLLDDEKQSLLGKLITGAGLTGGGVAVYELIEFAKANPTAVIGLLKAFGADFVLAVILILLVNRLVGVMEKSASSNQEMADAIQQIANKDERTTERMQLLTQYSAQVAEDVSEGIAGLLKKLEMQDSALDRIERLQAAMQSQVAEQRALAQPLNDAKKGS